MASEEQLEIDPRQPIPLYFQLKTLLREEILSGRYVGPDDRLPTEHELCERYKISRTPVSRALTELADEGVILRHRRRGSFVNPHWLGRRPDHPEIRVVVPSEGPWARMIRDAAGKPSQINVVKVPRQSLHQTLTHAVAEGQAPDLAVIDSVWAPEFAVAGFIHPLEELNEGWVREEHEVDFLEPHAQANRYEGKTFGISPFADASGLWYRRQKLESLDLAPPVTWTELRTVGRAIAQAGLPDPMVMPGGGMAGETTAYCLIAVLASNAAHVLGGGGVTLGSRAAAQALRFLRSLVEEGIIPSGVVGYDWTQPVRLLAEGRAALSLGGLYEAQTSGGGSRGPPPRGLGSLRVHVCAGRPAGFAGERHGRDDVGGLSPSGSAQACDATARADRRARGPRAGRARNRSNPFPTLGDRARGPGSPVALPGGRHPRTGRGETLGTVLSAGLGAAADDARGGSHRTTRSRCLCPAHRRDGRRHHRASARARA